MYSSRIIEREWMQVKDRLCDWQGRQSELKSGGAEQDFSRPRGKEFRVFSRLPEQKSGGAYAPTALVSLAPLVIDLPH